MEKIEIALFITLFIIGLPVFFKILLESNIEKFFKQGRIFYIRLFMVLLTIILSFLFAFSIKTIVGNIIEFIK